MKNLYLNIKNSFFVVNKLYLLFAFLYFFIEDKIKGFYFLLAIFIFYSLDVISSKIPMDFNKDIEPRTFIYKKTDDKELKLDLWLPNTGKKSYPLVFFCHGGGWISGFRNQPNNVSWCKFFASNNIAAVSIDYRYGLKNTMEDILSDYDDALSYVRNNSMNLSVDKNNIILMGLSAGAHLSLLYGAYFSKIKERNKLKGIKAIVSYYGPSCLIDILDEDNKSLFAKFALTKTMEDEKLKSSKKEVYNYYSPINWISKNMLPCLLVHGKKDNVVPFNSSVKLWKKLKNYNVPNKFLIHSTAGHSFDTELKDKKTIEIVNETLKYIKEQFKKEAINENNKN